MFEKIFPPILFSVTHKFLWTLGLCKVSGKGTKRFILIQHAIHRNSSNIYREKLKMYGGDITIILILYIHAQD